MILKSKDAIYGGICYGEYWTNIHIYLEFEGNNVMGYYYDDYAKDTKVNLVGSVDVNSLKLEAVDNSIKFDGVLEGLRYSGIWETDKGKNSFELYNENLPKERTLELFNKTGKLSLKLSDGAGSRETTLNIVEDGSFEGVFSEYNKSLTGPEYPNGTRYYLKFDGEFVVKEKIDDYTYVLAQNSLNWEGKLDTDYYEGGYKYVRTEPFGFYGEDEYILCLPGKPIDELSDEVLSWDLDYKYSKNQTTKLPYYTLFGIKGEVAFFCNEN